MTTWPHLIFFASVLFCALGILRDSEDSFSVGVAGFALLLLVFAAQS